MRSPIASSASRRGFLRGLTTLPLIGGGAALAAPACARPAPAENPELLALGAELDAASAAFAVAATDRAAALARFEKLRPACPVELVIRTQDRPCCGERPRDAEGMAISGTYSIATVRSLNLSVQDYGPRTKLGREARRMLKAAHAYEAAFDEARLAAGVEPARIAYHNAGRRFQECGEAIMGCAATTFAGLAIKARAFTVLRDSGIEPACYAPLKWGSPLADSIVAVATADAARIAGGA